MMLPMRISVSVTPAARAGVDANNNAAKKAGSSHFIFVFINAASNAKLTGARDAYPAEAIIAPKTGLLKSNVLAGRRMGGAQRYPSMTLHEVDGYRCAPPILRITAVGYPAIPTH